MSFASPLIRYGLSKKPDGSMKLMFDGALDPEAVQHRNIFFQRLEIHSNQIVSAALIHGAQILAVTDQDQGRTIPATDGLITNQTGLVLTVTVADCVPIYFFDPKNHAIGLAHAGWRGTLQNIAAKMIDTMRKEYGSHPADIQVYVGAHIQADHLEVQEDVAEQFQEYQQCIVKKDGKIFIDLSTIIQQQLVDTGLSLEHIELDPACTYCNKKDYFSFRRDNPQKLEVMVAYIKLNI